MVLRWQVRLGNFVPQGVEAEPPPLGDPECTVLHTKSNGFAMADEAEQFSALGVWGGQTLNFVLGGIWHSPPSATGLKHASGACFRRPGKG